MAKERNKPAAVCFELRLCKTLCVGFTTEVYITLPWPDLTNAYLSTCGQLGSISQSVTMLTSLPQRAASSGSISFMFCAHGGKLCLQSAHVSG